MSCWRYITRRDFKKEVLNIGEEFFDYGEVEICSQFGCGKKLRPEEKLYGDKCIDHNGEKVLIVNKILANEKNIYLAIA